jgi:hypothetical protein
MIFPGFPRSTVVTAAIAGTCADFRRLFNDRDMMSAFVVWAVAELEAFATIFQRQVLLALCCFVLFRE